MVEIKIGFFGLLQILFIALKLTNYITWSWFWVLSPLILIFGIIVILIMFSILIGLFILIFGD